jgi:hypothetical protein
MGAPQVYPEELLTKALGQTLTVEAAARLVGCSSALIHMNSRGSGPLQEAISDQGRRRETLLASAIIKHKGILSKVAEEVGLDSGVAVRYHITRNPRLRAVFEEARERVVDVAEDNVFQAVEAGDLGYSWKLLQTLGKNRGYTERREIDAQVQVAVQHTATPQLVRMLDALANTQPQLVEAEFSLLGDEDRKLLSQALSRQEAAG